MIEPFNEVLVFGTDDEIIFQSDGELYYAVKETKFRNVGTGQYFYDNGGIYKLKKDNNGRFLADNIDDCYMGRPPSKYTEVVVVEPVEQIDTTTTLGCKACYRTFSFKRKGIRYKQKAREHITKRHINNGEPDEAIIEELIEEQ